MGTDKHLGLKYYAIMDNDERINSNAGTDFGVFGNDRQGRDTHAPLI